MGFLTGRVAGYRPDLDNPSTDVNSFAQDKFQGYPFTNSTNRGAFDDDPLARSQWKQAKENAAKTGTSPFQEYQRLSKGEYFNPREYDQVGRFYGEERKYGKSPNSNKSGTGKFL